MSSNVYIRDLCNQLHKLQLDESCSTLVPIDNITNFIQQRFSIPIHEQKLWHNGRQITNNKSLRINATYNEISILLSLSGGKGGFGSMLRAAGKLNKTTNKSAMRDLSGRRNRFIEQEKELIEWIKQQKTTKAMTKYEIQNDFRHIKKYGILPEKRMCHKGIHCKYKWKCKFKHPDDDHDHDDNNNNNKLNQHSLFNDVATDDEMKNMLLIGSINQKQFNNDNNIAKHKKKKLITLYGMDVDKSNADDQDIDVDKDKDVCDNNMYFDHVLMEIFSAQHHFHKLKYISRNDCDYIICDLCDKQFTGASWHCMNNCDFDVCNDCLIINEDAKQNDNDNNNKLIKEMERNDDNIMKIKSFSKNINRKRKRKEKKLNLFGLNDNYQNVNQDDDNDNDIDIDISNKCKCKLRGELNSNNISDPNEILIDIDLLFPSNINNINKNKNKNNKKGNIDIKNVDNIDELKKYGNDKLKLELKIYGMKCGGTLDQRAERLYLLKNKKLSQLPKNCFPSKKNKKRNKIKKPPRKKQRTQSGSITLNNYIK